MIGIYLKVHNSKLAFLLELDILQIQFADLFRTTCDDSITFLIIWTTWISLTCARKEFSF